MIEFYTIVDGEDVLLATWDKAGSGDFIMENGLPIVQYHGRIEGAWALFEKLNGTRINCSARFA